MENMLLSFAGIAIAILLICVFFRKENIKNKETTIYSSLLIINLLFCATAIIAVFYAKIVGNLVGIGIFQKIYMIEMLFMIILMFIYNAYIIDFDDKTKAKVAKNSLIIGSTISLAILITPLNVIHQQDIIDGNGMSYNIMLCATIVYFILTAIFSLRLFIRNKESFSKNIPFIVMIISYIVGIFLREYFPAVWFENFFFSFVLLIMYFTIENPDVKLIRKIELAKNQAEKANAAKTEFLSSMSHEIRTPLNAIVGFSESISDAETLEEAKENAKDILTASNNLLEIVNGILDISKIEANKMEIVNTEYNLKEEVEKLVKLIKPRIGEKPIELKYYIAPDIPGKLYGDKGKIKEIMTNILTNAVKYTKEGFIELKVNCINKDNESSLVISVEDTGRGIKPENIDKLFTKFERLNEDRNTTIEGAGLGLAITKKLVEMMGGKIIVQSVYGSGSKFTVYLKQRIITRTSVSFENNDTQGELNLQGKTVLVVDDNTLNIKVAEKLLKKYSIKVDSCETGFECIDKIKQGNHYDLILMDDMMPKMTGTETLHLLQEIPTFKDKTVVLTANAIEGMKEKYIEEGFDDYLAKPIEKYELERVLRKYLNKEKEHIDFEPIPESFYDISDTIVEKLNSEEITKNEKTQ
ncbi:MAG: ATP-binding protein [Candidatus Coprovivens sp.]